MPTDNVKIIVKKYADILKKNRVPFSKIYLFGSYATGKAKLHSDIDVAVVMKTVDSGQKYLDQKMKLWELTPEVDVRIEPIILEEEELYSINASTIGKQIIENGIRIQLTKSKKKKLPVMFRPLLWSLKWDDIDVEEDKEDIILNSINEGTLTHWHWIIECYGKDIIRTVLKKRLMSEFHPESLKLARLIFNVPFVKNAR